MPVVFVRLNPNSSGLSMKSSLNVDHHLLHFPGGALLGRLAQVDHAEASEMADVEAIQLPLLKSREKKTTSDSPPLRFRGS